MAQVEKEQEDSPRHSCGADVINTGQSAGTILAGYNYAGRCPK